MVADTYPQSGDGCLQFGDDVVGWIDVISVYYCFIGETCPQGGSTRYDAMDCYPEDQVDGSCNLLVRGGDGSIEWIDVICTYYRFVDDPACKPRRPCGP
jgi:hypothetical protein